jgi:hypothetical protein
MIARTLAALLTFVATAGVALGIGAGLWQWQPAHWFARLLALPAVALGFLVWIVASMAIDRFLPPPRRDGGS